MRDICARLKISPGNLTYHFHTKNDIILSLCQDLINHVSEALNEVSSKKEGQNTLVLFFKQCESIGLIQQRYRFIFEKRYGEIITSFPERSKYYRAVLKNRFKFYHQLHKTLVKEKLALPKLLEETNAFG